MKQIIVEKNIPVNNNELDYQSFNRLILHIYLCISKNQYSIYIFMY